MIKSFLSFLQEQEELKEASLGRFSQHLQKGEPIAIISADRNENGKKKNKEGLEDLKKRILAAGFGYNKSKGGYVEKGDDGSRINVDGENSIIIYATKDREKELKNFVIGLGKKYNQDSIFFRDTKGKTTWVSTRDDGFVGKVGKSSDDIGDFHTAQRGDYYTKVGNKKFSFADKKAEAPKLKEPIRFDKEKMDMGYYTKDSNNNERCLGRNDKGRSDSEKYKKTHIGAKIYTKYLWKNSNRVVKEN